MYREKLRIFLLMHIKPKNNVSLVYKFLLLIILLKKIVILHDLKKFNHMFSNIIQDKLDFFFVEVIYYNTILEY